MGDTKYPRVLLQFTNNENGRKPPEWRYDGTWRIVETEKNGFKVEERRADHMKHDKWMPYDHAIPDFVGAMFRAIANCPKTKQAVCDLLEGE